MMSVVLISLVPLFLCWGSFLNALGYRLLHGVSIISPRSYCPHCRHTLSWQDLIPVFSWVLLKGRCRYCLQPISWLYPFIELLTCSLYLMLVTHVPAQYWIGYGIFFSALIISIRTDLDQMLISRYVTLMLIPLGLALSAMKAIEISPTESALGVVVGYAVPYFIARIFYACTHKEGLGEGDMELLSFIGAFTGIYGCWITLLIGSLVGSVIGAGYIIAKGQPAQSRIPFGPFLALGAIAYILYQPTLTSFIWGLSI